MVFGRRSAASGIPPRSSLLSPSHRRGGGEPQATRRCAVPESKRRTLRRQAKERVLRLALVLLVVSVVSPLLSSVSPTKAYVVASGSMEPTIPTGALAIAGPGEVGVGSVVVYWSPVGANQIHRVIALRELDNRTYFVTRGDANDATDSFSVPAEHVRGVVKGHTPYLGYLWLLPTAWQVGLFGGLLALYLGITAWDARHALRKERAAAGAAILTLFLLLPAAGAGVGASFASTELAVAVAAPPVPLAPGTMGSAVVAADGNSAVVTLEAPQLWGEVVLWGCAPGADDCTVAFPPSPYALLGGSLAGVNASHQEPAATYYLEAYLEAPAGRTAYVVLHDVGAGTDVAASEVSSTSGAATLVRSGAFALSGDKEYALRLRHNGTGGDPEGGALRMAKLLSVQEFPTLAALQVRVASGSRTASEAYVVPERAAVWRYDGAAIDGVAAAHFEVVANASAVLDAASSVRLFDRTAGAEVAALAVGASATEPVRLRSGDVRSGLVDGHEYVVEFKRGAADGNATLDLHLARVVVLQSGFTRTVRYVDLSWQVASGATTFTAVGYAGRYHMAREWGGITGYFEATLANDGGGTSSARLRDESAGTAVAGSQVDAGGSEPTRARSGAVTLDVLDADYRVELKASPGTTADLRSAWLVVHQADGKTYDHALGSRNDGTPACTWSFFLRHTSSSGLDRMAKATVALATGGGLQAQLVVEDGVLVQASGSAVDVAPGAVLRHVVATNPSAMGTSGLLASLEGACVGHGIRMVQSVEYLLA